MSQSVADVDADAGGDDEGLGARLRAITVQADRMDLFGLPRPSAKTAEAAAAWLGSGGVTPARAAALEAAAAAVAAALSQLAMSDDGRHIVVQFHAAS